MKRARKNHRKAQVAFKKSQLNADEIAHQKANETYQHEIQAAKIRYEQNLANRIKTNCRKFDNYAKHFTRPQSSVDALEYNGKQFTQDSDKADILNIFFASVMVNEPDTLPYFKDKSTNHSQCIYDLDFSQENISKIMSKLNPGKAIGPDGIHPHVLKEVLSLANPLSLLFRHSLVTGTHPDDWMRANICALHKKGSRKSANNYRPVSLTSQVKVFERYLAVSNTDFALNVSV